MAARLPGFIKALESGPTGEVNPILVFEAIRFTRALIPQQRLLGKKEIGRTVVVFLKFMGLGYCRYACVKEI
jgi:hypothetical protein